MRYMGHRHYAQHLDGLLARQSPVDAELKVTSGILPAAPTDTSLHACRRPVTCRAILLVFWCRPYEVPLLRPFLRPVYKICKPCLPDCILFAKIGEINDAAEIHLTHDVTGRVLCVRVSEQWCF